MSITLNDVKAEDLAQARFLLGFSEREMADALGLASRHQLIELETRQLRLDAESLTKFVRLLEVHAGRLPRLRELQRELEQRSGWMLSDGHAQQSAPHLDPAWGTRAFKADRS